MYSWDNKPTDNSKYLIENLNDQTVIKAPGEISGNQFMVRNCQNCCIYLFDHINTVTVDDCKQCKIFIGPTKVNFKFVFFNRHHSILSFWQPQRILILHVNSKALPITYSVYCVFVELDDKLYNP